MPAHTNTDEFLESVPVLVQHLSLSESLCVPVLLASMLLIKSVTSH